MAKPGLISSLIKSSLLVAAVAAGFFLLGLFGLLFKISGFQLGAISPAAGLALTSVLIKGNRVLPGIFIGSFLVNAWVYDFAQKFFWLYFANAMGDCSGALIGSALIARVNLFPGLLDSISKIMKFMALSGLAGSLVPVSISVCLLLYYQITPSSDIPFAFLITWLGYILGIIIFAPLFLIIFGEPRPLWRRRRNTLGLPVILSFTLVTALFFYLNAVGKRTNTERLIEHSVGLSHAIKNRMDLNNLSLQAIKYLISDRQSLNSGEWQGIVNETLPHLNEVTALSWIDFSDNDFRNSRRIVSFENKPKNKNSRNDEKFLPLAVRKQLLSGLSKGEEEFLILQENEILLATPMAARLVKNQQESGILIAAIAMESLINEVFKSLNEIGCTLSISALPNSDFTEKLIFTNTSYRQRQPYYIYPITVFGQTWRISFYQDSRQAQTYQNWPAFLIMIIGMGFTGFTGLTLLYLTGRNFRTEAIIDERTEKLIQTKTSAESANKAKSQFLAKISHELRTPLNGISGFVQLLEKNRSLNQEARHQLGIIKQCAADLLTLINEILDTSAIESEQFKIQSSVFDFAGLFNETIQICKIKADEKGIKLIAQNNCEFIKLHGDEKRIRQILVNLTDNAIKYTREGSVIVRVSYENGLLKIVVTDTGAGIADSDLDRILLPFVQVHEADFVQDGVGLGLFIIKELVTLMEGNLTISSQPGKGSIFVVTLPLTVSNENRSKTVLPFQSNDVRIKQVRVLVVDDSEINLLFLHGLLEHIGCQVATATNGFEALDLIDQHPYDLALIDINMPLMNGLELVKKIRELQIDLKIAVVSAYADEEKINEAYAAGIDAYLTKPVEENQLVELIQSSLINPLE